LADFAIQEDLPSGRSTEITVGDIDAPQSMARVLKPFFQGDSR